MADGILGTVAILHLDAEWKDIHTFLLHYLE